MIALHDAIEDHPKFVGLNDDAFALWIRCIGYCRRELTDGFIPEAAARVRCRGKRPASAIIAELCSAPAGAPKKAPLWSRVPGGYQVHDYLEWNPESSVVEAQRKQKREAASLGGKRSGESRRSKSEAEREPESKHGASPSASGSGSAYGSALANPPDPDPYKRSNEPLDPCLPTEEPAPRPASPRSGSDSVEVQRIREALAAHPETARFAEGSYAARLEGARMSSGTSVDQVVAAVASAAHEALDGELPNITWSRIRVFCGAAKKRAAKAAAQVGPAPKYTNNRVQHDPPGKPQGWKTAKPIDPPADPTLTPEVIEARLANDSLFGD